VSRPDTESLTEALDHFDLRPTGRYRPVGWHGACALLALLLAGCGPSSGEPVATARWESRAPVPEGRTEVSVTTDGSLVYLLGGFGIGEGRAPAAPRAVLAYDPSTDGWKVAGELPEGVNHAGLVAAGGKLYVVGGFRDVTFAPTGAVRIYDPSAGTWREGAPMPTPRGALALALVQGKIHALGGTAEGGADRAAHEHGARREDNSVATHEVYDPATDTWSRRPPMPTPRNHLGAAVLDGRIHVVGGRVGRDMELTVHEIYDPGTASWSAGPALPTGRSGIAVVAFAGRLYVFGGETVGMLRSRTFDDAERFDPATGRWETLPPMPTPRHGLGAAPMADAIYVVSGGPKAGLSLGTANERLQP
jgi:N-acetylneuraminic acid mutarotase